MGIHEEVDQFAQEIASAITKTVGRRVVQWAEDSGQGSNMANAAAFKGIMLASTGPLYSLFSETGVEIRDQKVLTFSVPKEEDGTAHPCDIIGAFCERMIHIAAVAEEKQDKVDVSISIPSELGEDIAKEILKAVQEVHAEKEQEKAKPRNRINPELN
jgi:hypothetical protein